MSRHELFVKPDAPKTSWWLCQTREEFWKAHQRELARLKREHKQTGGEMRIIGSVYGKP